MMVTPTKPCPPIIPLSVTGTCDFLLTENGKVRKCRSLDYVTLYKTVSRLE